MSVRTYIIGFIDYRKAFDKVRHNKLIEIMTDLKLDLEDINIITNLYRNQKGNVLVESQKTDDIEIQRGVRQGCFLHMQTIAYY